MVTHRIELVPAYRLHPVTGISAGNERALMSYQGKGIGDSSEPICDAARYLLKHGLAQETDRIETWRGETLCLKASVDNAAKLTVRETASGPKFFRYAELPPSMARRMPRKQSTQPT